MIDLAVCTEGVYAAVFHACSSAIETTIERSKREMAIEEPNVVMEVLSICVIT
jgi:hypothetical protein